MRSFFGVAPDRLQFGYDYAALEARVSGHFVIPYTDGIALAESYVAKKPNDCFDQDTLLLTNKGWIHSDEITFDTLIANWSTSKQITYTTPSQIIRRKHEGDMVRVLNERLDIRVTPNHILIVYNKDSDIYLELEAKDLKEYVKNNPNSYIPTSGIDNNNIQTYNLDDSKITYNILKPSGTVIQTYDYDTIVGIVTKERLNGSSSYIIEKKTENGIIYQTLIGNKDLNKNGFKLFCEDISTETTSEDVWCVTVPTHAIFVKRKNSIYVSSQCHTVLQHKLGLKSRDEAKTLGYSLLYGASYKKISASMKISLAEGKKLYEAYWDAVPALKELRYKLEQFWGSTGNKYILSIDKRKLFVRSKHSLMNLLFQSTGALIMKYGNLETTKRLDDLGLFGDPFYDTRDAKKIFSMIIYHKQYCGFIE